MVTINIHGFYLRRKGLGRKNQPFITIWHLLVYDGAELGGAE